LPTCQKLFWKPPIKVVKKLSSIVTLTGAKRPRLPDSWDTVESWATTPLPFYNFFTPENKEISINKIQGKKQPDSFWTRFPKRDLPTRPITKVNVKNWKI
jgi:hypothetical protein